MLYTESIERLIEELRKLPGVGPKMAQRLAFYILKAPRPEVIKLANSIVETKNKTKYCSLITAHCTTPLRKFITPLPRG